ncbi:hypothetical protein JOB18_000469 [Solea senegalensis]|uniref:Uncharacterized protein n=1 Tax=Solea senegalensis TaxID=28829 RepID=A0AAV6R6V1_SOLSE|nr:hypothetical protein JOB18_000469 [Solea senegalensis]
MPLTYHRAASFTVSTATSGRNREDTERDERTPHSTPSHTHINNFELKLTLSPDTCAHDCKQQGADVKENLTVSL